jgi:hypothetical protein
MRAEHASSLEVATRGTAGRSGRATCPQSEVHPTKSRICILVFLTRSSIRAKLRLWNTLKVLVAFGGRTDESYARPSADGSLISPLNPEGELR